LVCCGQTVGRIKMKLGLQVGLGPGHIVLVGPSSPLQKGGGAPKFLADVYCGQTVAHLSYCCTIVQTVAARHVPTPHSFNVRLNENIEATKTQQ